MFKRALHALKRTFMHVSVLPTPCFDLKRNQFLNKLFFQIKIWWGRHDMHKRAFQGLKCTFIHVSCLSPPYFDKKPITLSKFFINQNMVEEDLRHA